jgi:hypothetical protein
LFRKDKSEEKWKKKKKREHSPMQEIGIETPDFIFLISLGELYVHVHERYYVMS